jgi:hypothetical protein
LGFGILESGRWGEGVKELEEGDNRDGPVSIIYIIIAGIELYNNNGWSIIIFILCIKGYTENLA